MVAGDGDDLYRRVRRLEAVVSTLIVSEDLGDPELSFVLSRLIDDFDEPGSHDVFYHLRELFRRQRKFGSRRRRTLERRFEEISERTGELARRLDRSLSLNDKESLAFRVERIAREMNQLAEKTRSVQQEAHENLLIKTMGLDQSIVAQRRYAPVRIYISEDSPKLVVVVERAVTRFADKLGFIVATEYPPEQGSWFKRLIVKSKDALTSEQTEEIFKKGKRAIELSTLDKLRAEVNRENAQAAGDFIKSIENVPHAVAQFGSLLIIKTKGLDGDCNVMARVLTEREMEFIENNQDVMKDPTNVLDRLAKFKLDEDTTVKFGR